MSTVTDQQLLGDYARNQSEAAFSELVRRHIDLVHSAALRMVADPHLAEDVTQAVFLALARDVRKLQGCAVLSAWLHRTARNQASTVVRGEVRRRKREQEAAIMNSNPVEPEALWDQLSPQLDEALAQLGAADREALLLRFFEHRTAREIGLRLGLSEEATQKRLARALERLREMFALRGTVVSAASLAAILPLQAVQTAPAALAATVAATTFATVSTGTTLSVLPLMASIQIKTGVVALVTAGLATVAVLQHNNNFRLRTELDALSSRTNTVTSAVIETNKTDALAVALAKLRAQQSELLRLRGEVAILRKQERQAVAAHPAPVESEPRPEIAPGFIPLERWMDVGNATPQAAFQSFLNTLKTGDAGQILATPHWEIQWKDEITDEDQALVEKSMADYLTLLQRAPERITAYNLTPVMDEATGRTRVFFQTQTASGEVIDSNFEMVQFDGEWKPVLGMRWIGGEQFATTPVFGPRIDLDP